MSGGAVDWRGAAAILLLEHGMAGAEIRAAGPDGEIALLSAPADRWEQLLGQDGLRLAREVKALGFRYVALELGAAAEVNG